MLLRQILVAIMLPFAGTCAVFAVYICLVLCAMRRSRAAAEKAASKGLSPDELEKVPVAVAAGEAGECAVCLEEIGLGQTARVLPACKHAFHVACADEWLARNAVCPVCRASLASPPPPQIKPADDNC